MPDYEKVKTWWIVDLSTRKISIGRMTELEMLKYRNTYGGIYETREQAEWRATQNW